MKYMTDALLVRSRSDDPDIADAATAEWVQAIKDYRDHIDAIRPNLTESIQSFLGNVCLHDARFLGVLKTPAKRKFSLLLQHPGRDDNKFILAYYLSGPPKIQKNPGFDGGEKEWQWVLYDEIDLVHNDGIDVFSHSILFTGGWEMQLLFNDMKIITDVELFKPNEMGAMSDSPAKPKSAPRSKLVTIP